MTTVAIINTIIVWLFIIGGLAFCFSKLGKGGGWED